MNALPVIQPCLVEALSKIKPKTIFNQIDHGFPLAYPAQISDFPPPEADAADVELTGTRILVSRRSSIGTPEPRYVLYTSCYSILVFVKQ